LAVPAQLVQLALQELQERPVRSVKLAAQV
jgi:hypothetical protein